jgi:NDP-sugar pyrophosphorylase family protein
MTSPAPADGVLAEVKAVILAGGRGTRLHPFTVTFPKPLMPLGDTPVVETLLQRLIRFGCRDVTLTLGHLAELTRAHFAQRNGAYPGLTCVSCRRWSRPAPPGRSPWCPTSPPPSSP